MLSWTKARAGTRIATASTQAEWVTHAQTPTNRELETLASFGLPRETVAAAQEKRCHPANARTRVFRQVPADQADRIEDAFAVLIQPLAKGGDPSYQAVDRAERYRIVMQECPIGLAVTTHLGHVDETPG
ncbi:MAG: hypothetical protein ACI855_000863 [Myxococcota bacterium]